MYMQLNNNVFIQNIFHGLTEYIYTHAHTHIYTHLHTHCVYVCGCIHLYIYTYVCVCVCVCKWVSQHICDWLFFMLYQVGQKQSVWNEIQRAVVLGERCRVRECLGGSCGVEMEENYGTTNHSSILIVSRCAGNVTALPTAPKTLEVISLLSERTSVLVFLQHNIFFQLF